MKRYYNLKEGNRKVNGQIIEVNLDARLEPSAPYTTIYSNRFAGNSGVAVQFNGPWENIKATLTNPATGTFSAVIRYSAAKD